MDGTSAVDIRYTVVAPTRLREKIDSLSKTDAARLRRLISAMYGKGGLWNYPGGCEKRATTSAIFRVQLHIMQTLFVPKQEKTCMTLWFSTLFRFFSFLPAAHIPPVIPARNQR